MPDQSTDETESPEGSEEDSEESDQVATQPVSSPATAGNPNSPTLKKAGSFNGLTLSLSQLKADFIELGAAEDLDGDSVTVSVVINPESKLLTFNEATNNIDLSVENLIELANAKGPLIFSVTATVTDENAEPRATVYEFNLKVLKMSDLDIGAYYANLIYQRVQSATGDKEGAITIPDFESISVSKSAMVTITFTENLIEKESSLISKDAL